MFFVNKWRAKYFTLVILLILQNTASVMVCIMLAIFPIPYLNGSNSLTLCPSMWFARYNSAKMPCHALRLIALRFNALRFACVCFAFAARQHSVYCNNLIGLNDAIRLLNIIFIWPIGCVYLTIIRFKNI